VADIPPDLLDPVRRTCLALPDALEEEAWIGVRWRVRTKTFAHVFTVDDDLPSVLRTAFDVPGPLTAVTFRVPGEELQALRQAGDPFYYAGWGRDVMGLLLDARTDWIEVGELLTDSYCLLAPRKLAARVDRPSGPTA
jgi:predicted DNA-binding protein (MmcQ/YjbR family)